MRAIRRRPPEPSEFRELTYVATRLGLAGLLGLCATLGILILFVPDFGMKALLALVIFLIAGAIGQGHRIEINTGHVQIDYLFFGFPWKTLRMSLGLEIQGESLNDPQTAGIRFYDPGRRRDYDAVILKSSHPRELLRELKATLADYRDALPAGEGAFRAPPSLGPK